ncbi:MAG: glycosyltransferase [Leptospirales bacterium]|jgi:glycosyltransferase involved in cell wall biosynthesis
MKVLLLGHNDGPSGAGRAVARLHAGLLEAGTQSKLIVAESNAGLVETIAPGGFPAKLKTNLQKYADRLPLLAYRKRNRGFISTSFFSGSARSQLKEAGEYDLVHVHWPNGGFLRPEAYRKFSRPLVWTLHDSWGFTGGCHVPGDCDRFVEQCGECPQLASRRGYDLSRRVWRRKRRAWRDVEMTLVTPSQWMADKIRRSSLLGDYPVYVLPNGIDTRIYRPFARKEARARLGLPIDAKVILFGAVNATSDPNKGYDLFSTAMEILARRKKPNGGTEAPLALTVFGSRLDPRRAQQKIHSSGYPLYEVGSFSDDLSLALIYSAADVMCVPSRQESFGQTAAEAMACGTPVVAFAATGLLDIVDHKINGYLAEAYDPADFARGVEWALKAGHRDLESAARQKIETTFRIDRIAKKHTELYESLIL